MSIPDKDIERARALSMELVAGSLVELRGKNEKRGPCPVCGGNDRFVVFKDDRGWLCRGCNRSGDAIALIMHVERCSFSDAVGKLLGESYKSAAPRKASAPERSQDWKSEKWQKDQRAFAKSASTALADCDDALAYLNSRAISRGVARSFGLGYATPFHPALEKKLPAITVPWFDRMNRITALKFRALAPPSPKYRFWQKGGSQQLMFGAHLARGTKVAIITEGEFNAMALYSAVNHASHAADIMSIGGDTNRSMLCELAKIYPRMLLWFDEQEEFERAAATLPSSYRVDRIISPKPEEARSLDANDILIQYGAKVLAGLVDSTLGSWRT